jgi:hypothetical protein
MIEVTELMVGDIVRVAKDVCIPKGTVVFIKGIDADNCFREKHLVGSATCLAIYDKYRMTCGVWVDYLEPIPLTRGILEKIGFVEKEFYSELIVGDFRIICDLHNVCIQHNEHVDLDIPIEYLHELQHAFRLCRISIKIGL